ncbi:MAG TPA: hypothetical protein VLZ03_07620, partial [Thermodesulfobacteriota bacterium]|nr:hypothetical protein [Thermodesulfobacteriota bacterium]
MSVSAQTGYQHMDLNFRAPIITNNVVGLELFTRSPVHLRLHDGNLWVSGIAADAKIGGLSGFFDWKIAKPREAEVISPSEPFWGGLYSAKWHDCNLKWWAVNAGAGFDILNRFSIVDHLTLQAGLKAEHLNLGLGTPIDDPTLIPQFKLRFGDDYRGYLESELLIPWMGFQVQASRLNASVRFSPYAYANVKIPFSYYFVGTPLIGYEHEVYTFRNHGMWLEGNLAYEVL